MNILFIDTSSSEQVVVGLEREGKKQMLTEKVGKQKSQAVLGMLDKLLSQQKILLKDISEIRVHTGPGSFTGLRVGVSVANALGFLLNIPVNEMPVGTIVEPVYS